MNSSSRWRGVRWCSSQYRVIGTPLTRSMTKYGRPSGVVPASSTRAMLAWSIRASAWRSASKRAMTCRESIPALMSFTATSRLTGSVCWAIQTVPMPPSPMGSMSLYEPITVPVPAAVGWSMVARASTPAGRSRRLSGAAAAASRASMWAIRASSPPHASRTYARRRSGPAAGGAADGDPEPASGVRPVLLGGGERHAQRGGRLLGAEAGEEPELDELGLAGVLGFEPPESLVQGEQAVAVPLVPGRLEVVEVEPAASAAGLAGLLVPGPVD